MYEKSQSTQYDKTSRFKFTAIWLVQGYHSSDKLSRRTFHAGESLIMGFFFFKSSM